MIAQRLALSPPPAVQHAVARLRAPSRHVRWTAEDQLHVTLRFLGELLPDASELLIDRLAEVRVESFLLPVESAGAFPQKGPPRVLWVGIGSGHPRLHQLRNQIDDILLTTGIEVELRTFHPHITMGRCDENAGSAVNAWVRIHRDFAGPVFLMESFDLYASELRPGGAEYRLLRHFPLALS